MAIVRLRWPRQRRSVLGDVEQRAGARGRSAAAFGLLSLLLGSTAPPSAAVASLPALPFEYSPQIDVINQGEAVKYFEEKFYENNRGALTEEELAKADNLRARALQEPVLALAAAQVLYMFAWFRPTGEIIRENVVAAAQLFERSLEVSPCAEDNNDFMEFACDIRYMHAVLLYRWLGDTEQRDLQLSRAFADRAAALFRVFREFPRYAKVRADWKSPAHISLNSMRFPGLPSRPVWDAQQVGIGRWLEEHHHIFKAELQALINDPRGDVYGHLVRADPSREHLATPGGWESVRIVRYHHWYELFCELAPRTCELLASRPEISNCSFMNVNYVRLQPGTHLKPHFGNGPRLTAHLSLIVPEPLRAGLTVADEQILWYEGKAFIFDDTYQHSVSHWGQLPRYVMLVWFCHPCDDSNEHGQVCPETVDDGF